MKNTQHFNQCSYIFWNIRLNFKSRAYQRISSLTRSSMDKSPCPKSSSVVLARNFAEKKLWMPVNESHFFNTWCKIISRGRQSLFQLVFCIVDWARGQNGGKLKKGNCQPFLRYTVVHLGSRVSLRTPFCIWKVGPKACVSLMATIWAGTGILDHRRRYTYQLHGCAKGKTR